MILRLWRAPVEEENVEPFAEFMRETLYPALEDQAGFRGMTTAVERSSRVPEVVAVSLWSSMEDLEGFAGPDPEGVIFDEAERYLAGEPTVEHAEVLDRAPGSRAQPP